MTMALIPIQQPNHLFFSEFPVRRPRFRSGTRTTLGQEGSVLVRRASSAGRVRPRNGIGPGVRVFVADIDTFCCDIGGPHGGSQSLVDGGAKHLRVPLLSGLWAWDLTVADLVLGVLKSRSMTAPGGLTSAAAARRGISMTRKFSQSTSI